MDNKDDQDNINITFEKFKKEIEEKTGSKVIYEDNLKNLIKNMKKQEIKKTKNENKEINSFDNKKHFYIREKNKLISIDKEIVTKEVIYFIKLLNEIIEINELQVTKLDNKI